MPTPVAEEVKQGSDNTGSPEGTSPKEGQLVPAGSDAASQAAAEEAAKAEPAKEVDSINLDDYVEKINYEELERKLGSQGQELGDLRGFLREITPLLDKLQEQPELVSAIMDGKIDAKLAQSVLDGEVTPEAATQVAEAHSEVKKDMSKDEYDKASPEDISKMIDEKLEGIEEKLSSGLTRLEESRDFKDGVNTFIENTADFAEYAEDISKWLEEHPKHYDIQIAYDAVKGRRVTDAAVKASEETAAENAKNLALNAGGGGSQGGSIQQQGSPIDDLVAGQGNPNIFR